MTRIFWYWSGRASRNVWCRSALAPLVRQGVADGSIHTGDPDALAGALFFLADLWLPPQSRPTTRTQQRARNRVFQQMTRALGLDLLTEEQALQLEELCPEK